MEISFFNSNDKQYQTKLNALLKPEFLDFKFWYDLDLWDSNYESYSIMENNEIVSNICAFKTDIVFHGRQYMALSIGAVTTKPEYRNMGYSRLLMEHIINKYPDTPMYLSANETVLDFYPRFGFKRISDRLPISEYKITNDIVPRKLRFDDPKIWDYVYKRKNFSTMLDCKNTASINIFHIYWGYLKDCIYEIPELEALVIASQKQNVLKITGVFSLKDISFKDLSQHLPFKNVSKVEFGFMPHWKDLNFDMRPYEADPLFVRGINCDLGDFKFPEISFT